MEHCTYALNLVQFVWDHHATFERLGDFIKITVADGRVFLWIPAAVKGRFCLTPSEMA